jgi:Sec-independent protein secretion pathway component TatC
MSGDIEDKPQPLIEHLMELRTRLMWAIGAFFVAFIGLLLLPSISSTFWSTPTNGRSSGRISMCPRRADLHCAAGILLHPGEGRDVRRHW